VVIVELLEHQTAERLHRAYGSSIQPIVTADAVARTAAHALRQRGLGQVVEALIDFRGNDLHVVELPELVGTPFGGLVDGLRGARPIGVVRADGAVALCPPFADPLAAGERLVVVTARPDRIELDQPSGGDAGSTLPASSAPPPTAWRWSDVTEERLVVIGWSDLADGLLTGWAAAAAAGSRVDVLVEPQRVGEVAATLPRLDPIPMEVHPSDDPVGDALTYGPTTVVVLAATADTADAADVRTLLDVRALTRLLGSDGTSTVRLVVELRDAAHRELIDLPGVDDLVISDAIGSQFIAQLVDQPMRRTILLALYRGEQATLRLLPCEHLDLTGEHTVRAVARRAASAGLLVLGWRRAAARGGHLTLNPDLDDRLRLDVGDALVVVGPSAPSSGADRDAA
jgi:hypothetical protein